MRVYEADLQGPARRSPPLLKLGAGRAVRGGSVMGAVRETVTTVLWE